MGKQIKKISTQVFYFLKERRVGLVAFLANHFLLMHLRFLVNHHSDNVLILLWKSRFRRSLPICRNQLHVLKVNVIEKCFTLTNVGGEGERRVGLLSFPSPFSSYAIIALFSIISFLGSRFRRSLLIYRN